jgi:hypothetical protein
LIKPDLKFGYHIYWIIPLFVIGELVYQVQKVIKRLKFIRRKQKWINDPEIRRMRELAGLDNNGEHL